MSVTCMSLHSWPVYTASVIVKYSQSRPLPDVSYYNEEKNRQAKNGGAEGGGWCEREYRGKLAGEEPVKVGWTRGNNGTVDEESGCAQSGR